jgi:hypothetical protein
MMAVVRLWCGGHTFFVRQSKRSMAISFEMVPCKPDKVPLKEFVTKSQLAVSDKLKVGRSLLLVTLKCFSQSSIKYFSGDGGVKHSS